MIAANTRITRYCRLRISAPGSTGAPAAVASSSAMTRHLRSATARRPPTDRMNPPTRRAPDRNPAASLRSFRVPRPCRSTCASACGCRISRGRWRDLQRGWRKRRRPRCRTRITVGGGPVVGQIDNERPSSRTYATAKPACGGRNRHARPIHLRSHARLSLRTQGGLRPRPAARGSLRSPCSPANTRTTSTRTSTSSATSNTAGSLR